jgi:carboxyl-terminal processing protease
VSRASHAAAFAAGAIVAITVGALAVPKADTQRFKTLDTFAQSLSLVETVYVDPVDEKALVYDAAKGMLHNLDPHSTFLPPNRYKKVRQDTEGEYGTVGITLSPGFTDEARPRVPPYPIVEDVVPGSPASVAGIQLDDRVVAVEGEATAEPGHELREAGAWEAKLRGASGTRITISVIRVGWKDARSFPLIRAQVKQPSVRDKAIDKGIGYIAITRFSEATSADTAAALARLRAAKALDALVLDLRNDPGGLVDQAVATADLFLDAGTIVTIRGRKGTTETQTAHKGGPGVSIGTIIAIVDQGTASAAEIVAAALRENDRAKLVGIPTYGKGTVQTFFDLDDGSGLKLTTARYYTPKGNSLESNGNLPDLRVEAFTPEEIVAGSGAKPANDATIKDGDDDPQLVTAVKLARAGLQRGSR